MLCYMKNAEDDEGTDSDAEQNVARKIPSYERWWNTQPPWVSSVVFVCQLQLFFAMTGYCFAKKGNAFILLLSVTGIGLLVLWLSRDDNDSALVYLVPIGLMTLIVLLLS